MKCTKCGGRAVIDLKRHNSGFCKEHFLEYFDGQVRKAIDDFAMFEPEDRILVAVSGGKDSLVLWDALLRFGYQADGLYIDLGIPDYAPASTAKVDAFLEHRPEAVLRRVSLSDDHGYAIPEAARRLRRAACSPCGLSKRYIFNREALQGGYDVVCTGHNLDDEAAVLFGNMIRWQVGYLGRQYPVLEERDGGLIRKVKPLIRVTEKETAAYAVLTGIDYMVEECPMAAGARSLLYKDLLNQLEARSPGSKQQFLWGFFEHGQPAFEEQEGAELTPCSECGQPTSRPGRCAFCRMTESLTAPA
ncbi:MAG TPA: ATP-binding protein [Acidobacteriota bacterium]|nr:ATP-binding protein [Acidobacteriota bacterium]